MKKITLLFIALAIGIMLLGLAGCGAKQPETAEPPAAVGLANPLTELSKEEFDKSGFGLIPPEGAADVKYFTIATDPMTYQMTFTLNGSGYTVRVQPTGSVDNELPDISGMYYEWENQAFRQVGYNEAFVYWIEGGPGHITWLDKVPGLLYDVSVDTGANADTLASVAATCCPPTQGDVG